MKIKTTTAYSILACLALISHLFSIVGLPMGYHRLVSFSVMLTTVISALALMLIFVERDQSVDRMNDFTIFVILVATIVLSLLVNKTGFSSWKKILTFLQLPAFLFAANRSFNSKMRDVIYVTNGFYPILFWYFYNAPFAHRYEGEYGFVNHKNITLGFSNPNEAALYIMICAIIVLAAVFHYKAIPIKVLFAGEFALLLFLLNQSGSRAAILMTFAILLIVLLVKKISLNAKKIRILIFIPLIVPLVLYCFPQLGDYLLMKETIDNGRGELVADFVKEMNLGLFLLGDFKQYPLINWHNAPLSIMAAFGTITLITYWEYMYRGYKKLCIMTVEDGESKTLLLGAMVIIIYSAVESSLLVSGAVFALSGYLLLFLLGSGQRQTIEE